MSSFSFCLSGNVLISCIFLKDSFWNIKLSVDKLFFFQYFKLLSHCFILFKNLLTAFWHQMFLMINLLIIVWGVSCMLWVPSLLLLSRFFFFFFFVFWQFEYNVYWYGSQTLFYLEFKFLKFVNSCVEANVGHFQPLFLSIICFAFLSPPSGNSITCVFLLDGAPQVC